MCARARVCARAHTFAHAYVIMCACVHTTGGNAFGAFAMEEEEEVAKPTPTPTKTEPPAAVAADSKELGANLTNAHELVANLSDGLLRNGSVLDEDAADVVMDELEKVLEDGRMHDTNITHQTALTHNSTLIHKTTLIHDTAPMHNTTLISMHDTNRKPDAEVSELEAEDLKQQCALESRDQDGDAGGAGGRIEGCGERIAGCSAGSGDEKQDVYGEKDIWLAASADSSSSSVRIPALLVLPALSARTRVAVHSLCDELGLWHRTIHGQRGSGGGGRVRSKHTDCAVMIGPAHLVAFETRLELERGAGFVL